MSDNKILAELYAKECIRSKTYAYSRAVDRIDEDFLHQLFTEDAIADYGPEMGKGRAIDIVLGIFEMHKTYFYTSHQLCNMIIDVDVDAGTAVSELRGVSYVFPKDENGNPISTVSTDRKFFKWKCIDGDWKCYDLLETIDLATFNMITGMNNQQFTTRDKTDLTYQYGI